MKRILSILICIVIVMSVTISASAIKSVPLKSIKLDNTTITLDSGKAYKLKVSLVPANTTQKLFKFTTSDKNIATIDASGKITAVNPGSAKITVVSASNKNISAKCNVSVLYAPKYPIVNKPLTLTYWAPLQYNVSISLQSLRDMAIYKAIEKKTGIHISFQHPIGDPAQQFNIMLASGDLPDMIECNFANLYPGGPEKAIKDNLIIRLNDVIAKFAPNLTKVFNSNPLYRKMSLTDSGSFYFFPFIRGDQYLLTSAGPVIRQDWLDKLGLKMPTTIDEWHTVLKAFKDKDPNGNGKADEIPFGITDSPTDPAFWFNRTSAFVGAWGISNYFYQVDGKVRFGPAQPEYKEFLKTMNAWYAEKLIDPDFAVTDDTLYNAKVTNEIYGAGFCSVGGGIGGYMNAMKDKDPSFKIAGAPFPTLKAGDKLQVCQRDFPVTGDGTVITTSNKHVAESVKWLDYKYSEEGHMLTNFGIEFVSYTMENGYPTYTKEITSNPLKLSFAQALGKYCLASSSGPFVQDRRYFEQFASMPIQKETLNRWDSPGSQRLIPTLALTSDEGTKFAKIMNDVNTYYKEMFSKFIMGVEPLDNFDKYVQTMKQMGIDDAVAIEQAAFTRYNNRK